MILELGLITLGGYMWHTLNTKDKKVLKDKFNSSMEGIGLYNKKEETFYLYGLKETKYGWKGYIKIPSGLSLEHLNSKLNILEDNLNGIIEVQKDRFKDYIEFYMVNKDVDKYKFEPVKCKEYQLYIGKDFKLKNYILDINKDTHILIGGVNGTGKTFLLSGILTNLIYNSKDKIEIYLLQIAKSELSAFEDCTCVVNSSFNDNDCDKALNSLLETIKDRSNTFRSYGIKNITQWNKHYTSSYMKRIYVVIEELSFFIHNEYLFEKITDISKIGRSVGVHIISCVQRSTATNMPPDLKSQMTRITFRQKSSIDSTNIINTPDAKYLKERECIVDGNSDYVQLKTPWIDEDYVLLHKYVPDIKIPTKKSKVNVINIKDIEETVKQESGIIVDNETMTVTNTEVHGLIEIEEKDMKFEKRSDGIMNEKEFRKNVKGKGL